MISEPLRRHPEPRVVEWLDAQAAETPNPTTMRAALLVLGVESLRLVEPNSATRDEAPFRAAGITVINPWRG